MIKSKSVIIRKTEEKGLDQMIDEKERKYLKRAVELAEEALKKGDEPFGSILVSDKGEILFEDHNRVSGGDHTQHPEFAIARWAAQSLSPAERKKAVVYTSGEHCAMCSAAHAWVGLGRIVYASSTAQLDEWSKEMDLEPSPVKSLAIEEVIRDADVEGPVEEFTEKIRTLQFKANNQDPTQSK